MTARSNLPTVVVAGASGFIGRPLIEELTRRFRVVALTRSAESARRKHPQLPVEWVSCDLYSLSSVESALANADYAVYLVHSMLPTGGLTQASFADLDLLLADNFARAARSAGIRQIVYLGGLTPNEGNLSEHLSSRQEVERVLGGTGIPTTVLRAGLVIGAGGSSFEILQRLVSRLPAMILPAWTSTLMTPIALSDVVQLLERAVGDEEAFGMVSDVGSEETVSYRELLELTAEVMGSARPTLPVPFLTPRLSALWVHVVTGSPMELVRPLISSLECEMIARNRALQAKYTAAPMNVRQALETALAAQGRAERPKVFSSPLDGRRMVRSVQRLPDVPNQSMSWIAKEYGSWLRRFFRPLLMIDETGEDELRIVLAGLSVCLLVLKRSPESSRADRETFEVTGGALAHPRPLGRGRLEFRKISGASGILAALHEFTPRLPWFIYRVSQAPLHRAVMKFFGQHIAKAAQKCGAEIRITLLERATPAIPE